MSIKDVLAQLSRATGHNRIAGLAEAEADEPALDAHIADGTDAHDASAVSYAGGTGMSAANVETAIDELATEKADTASAVMDGDAAGGDLGGTYPSPSVTDDSHAHGAGTAPGAAHPNLATHDALGLATDAELSAAIAAAAHDPVTVGTGLDVAAQLVTLDLSEVAAGGELGGNMDAPTVDATHSGSTHSTATDAHIADVVDVHDHGSLAGLADDDHAQYLKETDFDDIDFLVGTATGHTGAEIVAGTSPGGELGGTWGTPTVDATHSGSTHAAAQAAAEATAAAALTGHTGDTGDAHDASAISFVPDGSIAATDVQAAIVEVRDEAAGGAHPNLATHDALGLATDAELTTHAATAHGSATHEADAVDAHDASAISIADAGSDFTATTVEGALDELQADNEAHVAAADPHTGYRLESADHSHESTGAQGGTLDEDALVLTDVTTNNAMTTKHGLLKKLSNVTTEFMRGDGTWNAPDHGSLGGLADDDHTQYALDSDLTTHAGAADPHTGYLKESVVAGPGGAAPLADNVAASAGSGTWVSAENHVHPFAVTTKKLWVPAQDLSLDGGAAGTRGTTPNIYSTITMANAATSGFRLLIQVPSDWSSGALTMTLKYACTVAETLAVRWQWTYLHIVIDTTTGTAAGTTAQSTDTQAHGPIPSNSAGLSLGTPAAAGNLIRIQGERVGADAADTCTGVIHLAGIEVAYSAYA